MIDDPEQVKSWIYPSLAESPFPKCANLITEHVNKGGLVVDLGSGAGTIGLLLKEAGFDYHGLEAQPAALQFLQANGLQGSACDLNDLSTLKIQLESLGNIEAFCLLDVIEHLAQPHELLFFLSGYLNKRKGGFLIVSVPNVAHRDLGLNLLTGQWKVKESGLLDSTHLRFFTNKSLSNLFHNCGWEFIKRDDFIAPESDQYDPALRSWLPPAVYTLLLKINELTNPYNEVKQFIWILKSRPITAPPSSFLSAVESPALVNLETNLFPEIENYPAEFQAAVAGWPSVEGSDKLPAGELLSPSGVIPDQFKTRYEQLNQYHEIVVQDRLEAVQHLKQVEARYNLLVEQNAYLNNELENLKQTKTVKVSRFISSGCTKLLKLLKKGKR